MYSVYWIKHTLAFFPLCSDSYSNFCVIEEKKRKTGHNNAKDMNGFQKKNSSEFLNPPPPLFVFLPLIELMMGTREGGGISNQYRKWRGNCQGPLSTDSTKEGRHKALRLSLQSARKQDRGWIDLEVVFRSAAVFGHKLDVSYTPTIGCKALKLLEYLQKIGHCILLLEIISFS